MKRNILLEIAEFTRGRVAEQKKQCPLAEMKEAAAALPTADSFAFEKALSGQAMAFICEVKKASPSKGIIAEDFPYLKIAREYERAGAAAISVLTEPKYFMGRNEYLQEISKAVSIPVLRKDFIVDEYQLYEAKVLGAAAVLLICSLLPLETLKAYRELADNLGMSCLVEAHTAAEIEMAIQAGARVIGVNNRNLADFSVDVHNSLRLRELVPEHIVFVSESGIKSAADIECLREHKVGAALIGEAFMRSSDKTAELARLNGKADRPLVKICGLKTAADAAAVNEMLPDMAGFVFADGRHKISAEQAAVLRKQLSPAIKTVGVFVNERPEVIIELCRHGVIDIIQLHGDESENVIEQLRKATGKPVIKAVQVADEAAVTAWQKSCADMLLFDAAGGARGGMGKRFDWSLLAYNKKPFMLAGGLNITNLARAVYQYRPAGVDISSGAETAGNKDKLKLTEIMELIRGMTK